MTYSRLRPGREAKDKTSKSDLQRLRLSREAKDKTRESDLQ